MTQSVLTQIILPLALFCIMLGVGLSVDMVQFRQTLRAPRIILLGVLLQLFWLPLLGLIVCLTLQLPPLLSCGIMILTLAPGGATSNMITYLARGDTALSIWLTAIAGLITPLTMPLLSVQVLDFWLGEQQTIGFPVLQTVLKLAVIAILPAVLGSLLRHYFPGLCQRLQRPVKILTMLFMLIVVVGLIIQHADLLLSLIQPLAPVLLFLICLAMLSGWLMSHLLHTSSEVSVTLAVEVGIQNAATALLLTAGILQNEQMSATVLFYGVLMNLPALLLILWRNRDLLSWQRV